MRERERGTFVRERDFEVKGTFWGGVRTLKIMGPCNGTKSRESGPWSLQRLKEGIKTSRDVSWSESGTA